MVLNFNYKRSLTRFDCTTPPGALQLFSGFELCGSGVVYCRQGLLYVSDGMTETKANRQIWDFVAESIAFSDLISSFLVNRFFPLEDVGILFDEDENTVFAGALTSCLEQAALNNKETPTNHTLIPCDEAELKLATSRWLMQIRKSSAPAACG